MVAGLRGKCPPLELIGEGDHIVDRMGELVAAALLKSTLALDGIDNVGWNSVRHGVPRRVVGISSVMECC
jgi:hypothetical protein